MLPFGTRYMAAGLSCWADREGRLEDRPLKLKMEMFPADNVDVDSMLDELEKGAWPSFVTEIKKAAKKSPMAQDVLDVLEKSYRDKVGYWKHGGIVGVMSYGGGIIGRYCDLPEEYPNVSHFHTMRINQPAGWFYNTDLLRKICDIWEKHGSGLTNILAASSKVLPAWSKLRSSTSALSANAAALLVRVSP